MISTMGRTVSLYELSGSFSGGNDHSSEKVKDVPGERSQERSDSLSGWPSHGRSDSYLA